MKHVFPPPGLWVPRDTSWDGADTRKLKLAAAGDRTYSIDANMILSDGAAAIAASGFAQANGADGFVDLGGNQNVTVTLPAIADSATQTFQQARIDAALVVDITARDIASGDEVYTLYIVGSNDPAFAAGKTACLGAMQFGKGTALLFPNGADMAAVPAIGGLRREIHFTNEQDNVKYQFVKLYVVVGGTTPSVTFKAFVAVLPEP